MRALVACFLSLAISPSFAKERHQESNIIKLRGRTIDTSNEVNRRSEWPIDTGLDKIQTLIQLNEMSISSEILDICESSSYKYVPENSMILTCKFSSIKSLQGMEGVKYVGPVEPSMKIPTDWESSLGFQDIRGRSHFKISIADGFTPSQLLESLNSLVDQGFEVLKQSEKEVSVAINEESEKSLVDLATKQECCSWIQRSPKISLSNKESRGIIQSGTTSTFSMNEKGLDGSGITIGITDSGLDLKHCFFHDPNQSVTLCRKTDLNANACRTPNNNHRKVVGYFAIADSSEDSGSHGTHVAGTAAGKSLSNNDPNSNQYASAYNSKIAIVDIFTASGGANFDLDDEVLPFVSRMGALISSNSWGYEQPLNAYNSDSLEIDDYSFENKDMLILFAAGNNGPGLETIDPHSNSKNGLSIGSIEKSMTKLASYSSKGPAHDGRIKPDLVSPGSDIVSAFFSSFSGTCNSKVASFDGTSMATPNAASAAALVYQYYKEGHLCGKQDSCKINPSSALVKATLINSGQHFSGGNDFSSAIAPAAIGFGRINLGDTLDFNTGNLVVFDRVPIQLNSLFMKIVKPKTGSALKVTLVWTDPTGSTNAAYNLVNDLDLRVISPSGQIHSGNKYLGFYNVEADGLNNIEQVLIPASSVEAGDYKVQVSAFSFGKGTSQDFSLVINLDSSTTCTNCAPNCPTSYNCGKENLCVSYSKVCDGVADCKSGADEDKVLCRDLKDLTLDCQNNFFINKNFTCNGVQDCPSGADEMNCNSAMASTNPIFLLQILFALLGLLILM